MPNYWLGIMALAFAAALALWIVLVFRAERLPPKPPQESTPHREVIGGTFDALEGGRQVMPHPGAPLVPQARHDVSRQGGQAAEQAPEPVAGRAVPEQRATPLAEQAPQRQNARHPGRRPARASSDRMNRA